jgi:tripartite-type tricarboxylate transporter receptor subunit TctC
MPPLHCVHDMPNIGAGLREPGKRVMGVARLLSCAAFVLLASLAQAQDAGDYPNRPIHIIVPVAAGAGIDTAARVTAAAAEPHLGGKFVIENKPGASQRLGSSMVAKSAPDGYTLLFTSPSPIVVSQFFPPPMDFDPAKELRPLVIGMLQPVLLIVRPNLGVKTVDEFVALAKQNPESCRSACKACSAKCG